MIKLFLVLFLISTPVMANKLVVPVNVTVQNGTSTATTQSQTSTQYTVSNGVKQY